MDANNQDIKADAGKPQLTLVPTEIINDIAYIRIDGELLFLQETTKSVKDAALDLLNNNIYEDDAFGGSLYDLAY